jgi:hypothetical protein
MKLLLLFALIIIMVSFAQGQDIRWGVEGGLNLSGGIARETGVVIKGKPALGYALGGFADIPLPNPRWSIRPNLIFEHEASNADVFDNNTYIRVNYIKLPIDLVYHSDWGNKKVFFGLGPWLAYGLSGKYTQQGYTYSIAFGKSDLNDAHHLDFGLDFLVGYVLKPDMMLTAKFDLGLRDVSAQPDFVTIHTRSFGVSFVYLLPTAMGTPKKK